MDSDIELPPGVVIERGVLTSASGMMYLVDGKHDPLGYALGRWQPHTAMIENFRHNITTRSRLCADAGVPYAHVISPDKQSALSEDFPIRQRLPLGRVFSDAVALPELHYIWEAVQGKLENYHRTDTHFSAIGNIRSMAAIFQALRLEPEAIDRFVDLAKLRLGEPDPSFSGDLGRRFDPHRTELSTKMTANPAIRIYENHIPGGNDGKIAICHNPASPLAKVLLVFGDSFFKFDLAAELFRVVVFLRTRYLCPYLFDAVRPDYVVTQNVERYLRTVSLDDVAAPFFLLPFLAGRAPSLDRDSAMAIAAALSRRGKMFRQYFGMA